MTKPSEESVFSIAKRLVPSVEVFAQAANVRHETAKRLHALALLDYAAAMTRSEEANQEVTNRMDFVYAITDLVNNGAIDMQSIDRLAADNADAYSVIGNILAYALRHPPSLLAILKGGHFPTVTEASKSLTPVERQEWINAILAAGDSE